VADFFSLAKLLPFAIFGVVALGTWLAMELLGGRKTRADERFDDLRDPTARRRGEGFNGSRADAMARAFKKATPAFARPLAPKNEFEASKLKARLSAAGYRRDSDMSIFLGFKFIGFLLGLFLFAGTTLATSGATQTALIYTVFGTAMMFYLPDIFVGVIASRRKKSIFLSMPDVLDLMVVCVEAGLGLDQAMRKVSEKMKKMARVVAEEFSLSNFQLQMGRQRAEVLNELGLRTGVDDLQSLATILIQADKFGSSVAQALRLQSDSMRTRRRQLAEEKAAKTAVKLIFPLVIFIFPGILVVLAGPAAITMVNSMFPAIGGH
jgi:tight adherence protein C